MLTRSNSGQPLNRQSPEPMLEITELIERHRECSRHIWNTYFQKQALTDGDWDLRDRFEEVVVKLFTSIVLWPLECEAQEPAAANWMPRRPVSFIRIVPPSHAVPILVNREIDSGYWDHPVREVAEAEMDLRFVCCFDWFALAVREFRFIMVFVAGSTVYPDTVGRYGLIEAQSVRAFYDGSMAQL